MKILRINIKQIIIIVLIIVNFISFFIFRQA